MKIKFGITSKLMISFFFFVIIFYGTIFALFINIQKMMKTSEQIVNINNQIAALSNVMIDSLMDMDINDKKFRILKKKVYRTYFETAKKAFFDGLDQILTLDSPDHKISTSWKLLQEQFEQHSFPLPTSRMPSGELTPWAEEDLMDSWMNGISTARRENQNEIEQSLIKINKIGIQSFKNSLIGLGVSLLAGILGAWFISKSMIKPLKKLKNGLKNISHDNNYKTIKIDSHDEFRDLASAFNDMSRQLKEDDDIRSDFIAVLSHEIRTPLSSIQESVSMIIEEVLGPVNNDQKKFLKIASSEITRISDLLNHLLDVSMLKSNSGGFDPEPMDPNQLILEASKSLISKGKLNDVEIILHELPDAPMVMGVKKEIMQVLLNIIGNAVKFSYKNSSVDIHVLDQKNSPEITFKISDQGPGIPEQEQSLIFKKYYRAKGVRQHMDGVGLGLNIAKSIILAHGGRIFMENNKDQGCSFFFTIPKKA